MGWYLRKSLNFGPVRLNLSRSGLGASFGVTGARVGIGPRGSYVHMGRGGLYYRQSLNPGAPVRPNLPSSTTIDEPLQSIDSGDVAQMIEGSSADLLNELNRIKRRISLFPLALVTILVIISALAAAPFLLEAHTPRAGSDREIRAAVPRADVLRDRLYQAAPPSRFSAHVLWWAGAGTLAAFSIPLLVFARRRDLHYGRLSLRYDLEPNVAAAFSKLSLAFTDLARSKAFWHIDARGATRDWKRNAGA